MAGAGRCEGLAVSAPQPHRTVIPTADNGVAARAESHRKNPAIMAGAGRCEGLAVSAPQPHCTVFPTADNGVAARAEPHRINLAIIAGEGLADRLAGQQVVAIELAIQAARHHRSPIRRDRRRLHYTPQRGKHRIFRRFRLWLLPRRQPPPPKPDRLFPRIGHRPRQLLPCHRCHHLDRRGPLLLAIAQHPDPALMPRRILPAPLIFHRVAIPLRSHRPKADRSLARIGHRPDKLPIITRIAGPRRDRHHILILASANLPNPAILPGRRIPTRLILNLITCHEDADGCDDGQSKAGLLFERSTSPRRRDTAPALSPASQFAQHSAPALWPHRSARSTPATDRNANYRQNQN